MANFEQWLAPVLALIAWPAVVVVVVLAALVLSPRDQRPAVLAGIAEVIRAARSKDNGPPAPLIRATSTMAIEQDDEPDDGPCQS